MCSEFCVLVGYLSGQDGAILPAWDCPFCSCNSIFPKVGAQSFLYQNIFCDTEKISCDFSVGMELENRKNQKTESINKNENNENKNVHKFQE